MDGNMGRTVPTVHRDLILVVFCADIESRTVVDAGKDAATGKRIEQR
jgi:hypothetical protein